MGAGGPPDRQAESGDCGIGQVNSGDPDGKHVHIDFDAAEAEGLGL